MPGIFKCTQCGAAFGEADIDIRRRAATCRFCGVVTELPPEPVAAPLLQTAQPDGAAVRPKVPRPNSIGLEQTAGSIRLTYRWFTPMLIFLAFFCLAWDSFLVVWYFLIGGAFFVAPGPLVWLLLLFPICHIAVGLALTYSTIAGLLNCTWIVVTRDELQVRNGPIPCKGNKTLPVSEVDAVFCTSKVANYRHNRSLFCVSALLKDGRTETVISSLPSAQEARYVERTIEEFLGLPHYPVAGELPL